MSYPGAHNKYMKLRPEDWARSNIELAARLRTTAHAVSAARGRYGAPRLPSGTRPVVNAEQAEWALERWRLDGVSFKVSAAALGVNPAAIRRALQRRYGRERMPTIWRECRRQRRLARLSREPERRKLEEEWRSVEAERRRRATEGVNRDSGKAIGQAAGRDDPARVPDSRPAPAGAEGPRG